ncbi:MAG: DUF2007 domain-containing protein [Bacteroidaceae bacterium]|nr:DUF2007 domain-containing protein [Bacteroidaceae bacterium]
MNQQDKLITIKQYGSNIDAHIARDILENEGIPCMLTNETLASIYPLSHTSLGSIRLLVFERDAQAALHILNNSQQNNI